LLNSISYIFNDIYCDYFDIMLKLVIVNLYVSIRMKLLFVLFIYYSFIFIKIF